MFLKYKRDPIVMLGRVVQESTLVLADWVFYINTSWCFGHKALTAVRQSNPSVYKENYAIPNKDLDAYILNILKTNFES